MNDIKTIVVPYDFSGYAQAALELAGNLAKKLDAKMHVLHVLVAPEYPFAFGKVNAPLFDLSEALSSSKSALEEKIADLGLTERAAASSIEAQDIAATVVEQAKQKNADLIVMGTNGLTGISRMLLGSVADRTLRSAHCPVLTTRESSE